MATHQSTHNLEATFCAFFEGWLHRQQTFLDKLIHNSNNEPNDNKKLQLLIEQVLTHYTEYYEEKARVIWRNIFLLFSPPWLTSLEKTFLWVGGFKPSLVFFLVEVSSNSFSSDQIVRLEELKGETSREERKAMDDLAAVQERVGSMPLMDLLKHSGRLVDGEVSQFADAMQEFREAIATVVQSADNLRRNTVMNVLGILNVNQSLKFLAAVGKYHLRIRKCGLQNGATQS